LAPELNHSLQEENMNKGFTLIETMVSLSVLLLAVLSSTRILVAVLGQTRGTATRFRVLQQLDYYKNVLASLPLDAAELAAGAHNRQEGELRVDWRVEDVGAALKRVRLLVKARHYALALVLHRSRFILAVQS
jgi:prepilin-type N-terminal cleavage/methylation domain-containing protein